MDLLSRFIVGGFQHFGYDQGIPAALPYLGWAFHGLNLCERAQLQNELYIWGALIVPLQAACLALSSSHNYPA